MTEVQIQNLSKTYKSKNSSVKALDCVSLKIQPGELFLLLGPSGCGKTTLLRTIAGLCEPTAGKIFFNDQDITNIPVEKRDCGMVFQSYALWPHMTVLGNVKFGPKMKRLNTKDQQSQALKNLEIVQMSDYAKRKPNELSGGQQQRVALARALAANPRCMLFDEPLSNLDARLRIQMRTEIRRIVKDNAKTSIYVTHDQKEAMSIADRIAVMNKGKIAQIGTPAQIYHNPANMFVADFIGEANFIEITNASQNENKITFDSPIGKITLDKSSAAPTQKPLTCCIRPEHIQLAAEKQNDPQNAFESYAKVEKMEFQGEVCQYYLKNEKNQQILAITLGTKAQSITTGTQITISAKPQNVILLYQ